MTEPEDLARKDMSAIYANALARGLKSATQQFRRGAMGVALRECLLCGYYGRFVPFGTPPRFDARCVACNGLERHRLFYLMMQRQPELFLATDVVLHFAPEKQLRDKVAALVGRYETSDFSAKQQPTYQLNIEAIELEDCRYDRVICNHLLEHVNDAKALAEMFRILRPGGTAFLSSPMIEGWAETYENPDVSAPEARFLHFGQNNHVRYYGRDLRDRIRAAGFQLEEFGAVEPDVHRYGLVRGDRIFIATRPTITEAKL